MNVIKKFISESHYNDVVYFLLDGQLSDSHVSSDHSKVVWHYWNSTIKQRPTHDVARLYKHGVVFDDNTKDSSQMVHSIVLDSKVLYPEEMQLFYPFKYVIEEKFNLKNVRFVRIKANLHFQDATFNNDMHNVPHCDLTIDGKFKSILWYAIDSDGDTFFFENMLSDKISNNNIRLNVISRYTPEANTAIMFDPQQFHAGSPPRNNKIRLAVNFIIAHD